MDDERRQPNVIWIFGDQHRAQALSCNGDPNVDTPHLDRLAANGVNLTGAVAGFPLCCPFRGSLLTGRYPHHTVPGHEYPLDPDEPTVAEVFNNHGYHTAYIGKWHLDGFHERNGRAAMHIVPPQRRGGFQEWVGYENNNSQWDCWVHGGRGRDAFHRRLPGYETDELTGLFLEYIRGRAGDPQPFFAALSVQPPHNPYVAPAEFMAAHNPQDIELRGNVPDVQRVREQTRRELAGYYAQIENLDWNIGRILDTLREEGLLFDTHILFFSDHGDMHGSHGQFRKMTPYEEALRIPFILSGEQPAYEGRRRGRVPVPINHVDIAPTTLGLCGIEVPDWMEGTDYSHLRLAWRQPAADTPDSAFLQSVVPTGHGNSVEHPWRGIVTRDGWKYTCFEGQPWMLFNLNEDPLEEVNLAHNPSYSKRRRDLNARLREWIARTGDDFRLPDEG